MDVKLPSLVNMDCSDLTQQPIEIEYGMLTIKKECTDICHSLRSNRLTSNKCHSIAAMLHNYNNETKKTPIFKSI